jgi:hypothetical protein
VTGISVFERATVRICQLTLGFAVIGATSWAMQGELLYALLVAIGGLLVPLLGLAIKTGAHRPVEAALGVGRRV